MQKSIIYSIFMLLPFIGLAQNKGQFSVGVGYNASWGGLQGFQPSFHLNAGKFIGKNFEVGINTSFAGNQYPSNRLNEILNIPTDLNNMGTIKKRSFGLNAFSKYYIGENRIRPFALAEVGMNYRSQKGSYTDLNSSGYTLSPHFALGVGVSSFLDKKRRAALEISYQIQNIGKIPNLDFDYLKTRNLEGRLNLGFKYIIK